jgi:DNA-directed RNA polymerase subunit RPC12/RpoP
MCIFCGSENYEKETSDGVNIECKYCNSLLFKDKKRGLFFVKKFPKGLKHYWLYLLFIPMIIFWFFPIIIINKKININNSLLIILFTIPILLYSFMFIYDGIKNIYNYLKNNYMIGLLFELYTKTTKKIKIIYCFLLNIILVLVCIFLSIGMVILWIK